MNSISRWIARPSAAARPRNFKPEKWADVSEIINSVCQDVKNAIMAAIRL